MTWAITITVLGFLFCWLVALPLGIASIVFSSKANSMRADGYIDGAIEEAEKAKKFASAATICTVIGFIFLVVYVSSNQALF